MNPVLVALLIFLLAPVAALAQNVGVLTMREGGLRVIRGTTVLQAAEGMRLRQGDILESSEPALAQLEFPGGSVVAMGPSTRVYILSHGGRGPAQLVLLSGWLKGQTGSGAGVYHYLSPLLSVSARDATLVFHAAPDQVEVFIEAGSASTGREGTRAATVAKAGQFLSRYKQKNVVVSARMSDGFVAAMPKAFKDTLPPQWSHFSGKSVEPKPDHAVNYADVEAWLNTVPAWRKGFVTRFQSRLADPAFRRSVEAHLGEHPEWDPVLHPEKYQHNAPLADTQPERQPR